MMNIKKKSLHSVYYALGGLSDLLSDVLAEFYTVR